VRIPRRRRLALHLIDDFYSDYVGLACRAAGLHKQPTIVWWETFGTHRRMASPPCARFIHYYTKFPSGFIFNTGPTCARSRKAPEDQRRPRATPDGKIPTTVWKVSRKQGTAHDRVPSPTPRPSSPSRSRSAGILLASNPGDLVVDGFNGNGTTASPRCSTAANTSAVSAAPNTPASPASGFSPTRRRRGREEGRIMRHSAPI